MRQQGFVLHCYAGSEDGYSLKRSLKGLGGRDQLLLELDKKRGSSHDMLRDAGPYPSLLRAALEGKLLSVIGGPNCRSRSVLRHRPVPGQPDAPRPIRSLGGGEFGASWVTEKEQAMLREDDILMRRMLFLFIIAEYSRKAQLKPDPVHLVLEQPASPREYQPEVVSFWDTKEWHGLRDEFGLKEVTFNQGCLGGLAPKPTTLGTTFDMCMDDFVMPPAQPDRNVTSSKQLERWAPGLMNAISTSIIKEVFKEKPQLKVLSWDEHVKFGHVPYRKDCSICQQSSQQIFPHRRNPFPQPGVLALDACGPLVPASDVGSWKCRYFLAGAYTFMFPKGSSRMTSPPEKEGGLEEAPAIEVGESGLDGEAVAPVEDLQGPIRLPAGGEAVAPAEDLQGPIRLPPVGVAPVELAPVWPPRQEGEDEDEEDGGEGEGIGEGEVIAQLEEEVKEQEEMEIRVFKLNHRDKDVRGFEKRMEELRCTDVNGLIKFQPFPVFFKKSLSEDDNGKGGLLSRLLRLQDILVQPQKTMATGSRLEKSQRESLDASCEKHKRGRKKESGWLWRERLQMLSQSEGG
eukprot:s5448_g4.t1